MNNQPNFLCLGAQKAGTTSLHDILKQHPDIYLPEIKETKFFADHEQFNKGLEYYQNMFFSTYNGEKMIGEIDPEYMYYDFVPERIYKLLGKDVKLIFMLRNPVSRAFSHYLMSLRRGYETLSFDEAIKHEGERIATDDTDKNWLSQRNNLSYIDRGFYAKQIKRYLEFFPIENMHFILFEDDFLKNKESTLHGLYEFLNLKSDNAIESELKSNSASEPRFTWIRDFFIKEGYIKQFLKLLITSETRKKMRDYIENINAKPISHKMDNELKKELIQKYYLDDIKELELLIKRNLATWLN